MRRTTDGGDTWTYVLNYSNHTWFDIAYYTNVGDPQGNNVIYFTGHNSIDKSNLYFSYDNGATIDSVDLRAGRYIWGQTLTIKDMAQL